MATSNRMDHLASILHKMVEGKASGVLLKRLADRLSSCPSDEAELQNRIDKTRVAVRMFVSEDLAEEVHRRLPKEAGL